MNDEQTDEWVENYVRRCQQQPTCLKVMMREKDIPIFEASLARVLKKLGITLTAPTTDEER